MQLKIGVIMDPIGSIRVELDSTLAMLVEAQKRHHTIYYMEPRDLFLKDNSVWGYTQRLTVYSNNQHWFDFGESSVQRLDKLDVILMRKDPPVNTNYIRTLQLLDHAETAGVLVINKPHSLLNWNEKLFITSFPQCCPPTLVTMDHKLIRLFLQEHQDIICKPLDGMGGQGIFRLRENDPNISVALEMLTKYQTEHIMAQRFIPEIAKGDKRILLIDGEPIPYALARIPAPGETRGNILAGGHGIATALSDRDRWICEQVGPVLREKGLFFVGLDVIGDYLTEINITSPGCILELEEQKNLGIPAELMDKIELKRSHFRS